MAHHASALKQQRQSLKRKARNRQSLSQLKTQVRKLRTAIEKGDSETAKKLLSETVGAIDKAAKKGVVRKVTPWLAGGASLFLPSPPPPPPRRAAGRTPTPRA